MWDRMKPTNGSPLSCPTSLDLCTSERKSLLNEIEKTPSIGGIENQAGSSQDAMSRPIVHIPSDVLALIFSLCTPAIPGGKLEGGSRNSSRQRLRMWLVVTHICKDWRATALEFPLLWSTPDFNLPALAREMISRSNSVPLRIHVDLDDIAPSALAVLSAALGHPAGIETLDIHTRSAERWQQIKDDALILLSNPAPALRSLTLSLMIRHAGFPSFQPQPLPHPFLGCSALQIKKVALSGCCVPWKSPLLKNLTVLEIVNADEPHGLKLYDLLRKLMEMPTLEELVLWNCLPSKPETPVGFGTIIHFPHMRRLRLSSTVLTCISLLDRISFPGDSTEVRVHCTYTRACDQADALSTFTRWLANLFRGSFGERKIRYLMLGDEPANMPNFDLRAGAEIDKYAAHEVLSTSGSLQPHETLSPFLGINIEWRLNVASMSVINLAVLNIMKILPLQALEMVKVGTMIWDIFTADIFIECLSKCAQLQSILIEGNAAYHLIRSLRLSVDGYVAVQGLYINSPTRFDADTLLEYVLQRRKNKLQKLVCRDCDGLIEMSRFNYIRKFVQEAEWIDDQVVVF
ncbi:hypothetical protein VNI00_004829 [Paramarasmius palmivorus]|uniref:F-box domain-containing protein n=1 Tax=Paramarasmius palmivorus TaxID=297713 RepID=A0AAW0DKH9_9AGAR